MKTVVDHLMWGVPDLAEGIAEAARLFGVTPAHGGAHAGLGTRNALLGLADGRYLEIIAPDPAQRLEGTFGARLADLSRPALVSWAAASHDLAGVARRLVAAGLKTRGPVHAHRDGPDGIRLAWQLLFGGGHGFGTLLPFYIDWRESPHPSGALPIAGALEALALQTPHAAALEALLGELDVPVVVAEAGERMLRATLETTHGAVVLETSPATVDLQFG